jgi:hypothetical protein
MQITKTLKIVIVILTALAMFGLYVLSTTKALSPDVDTKDSTSTTTTTAIPGTGLNIQSNGDYTITQIPVENNSYCARFE